MLVEIAGNVTLLLEKATTSVTCWGSTSVCPADTEAQARFLRVFDGREFQTQFNSKECGPPQAAPPTSSARDTLGKNGPRPKASQGKAAQGGPGYVKFHCMSLNP